MREAGGCVLFGTFNNSQLLPGPHPALLATFPGVEGFEHPKKERSRHALDAA